MNRVVQVDEELDLKTETITKKIIEDTIMIDLDEKQVEMQKEVTESNSLAQGMQVDDLGDVDLLQVPQNELSLFNSNISANRCYFQNPRQIENN